MTIKVSGRKIERNTVTGASAVLQKTGSIDVTVGDLEFNKPFSQSAKTTGADR
jgi:hypothetical protein